ncbi:hypothetical protein JCM3774_001350 [Rhodotorula dairenensis]
MRPRLVQSLLLRLQQHPFVVPILEALNGKGNAAKRVANLERLKADSEQDLKAPSTKIDFDPRWELAAMTRRDHRLKKRMFVAKGFALLDLAESSDERQGNILRGTASAIFKDVLRMMETNPRHLGMRRAELVVLLDTVYDGDELCTRVERFLHFFEAQSTAPCPRQLGMPVVNSLAMAFTWAQRLHGSKAKMHSPLELSLAALFNRLDLTPITKSRNKLALLVGKHVFGPSADKAGHGLNALHPADLKNGLHVGLPKLPFLQQLYKANIEDLYRTLEKLSPLFCKWLRAPPETHCVSGDFEGIVTRSLYDKGPPLITYSNHAVFGPSETGRFYLIRRYGPVREDSKFKLLEIDSAMQEVKGTNRTGRTGLVCEAIRRATSDCKYCVQVFLMSLINVKYIISAFLEADLLACRMHHS